MYIDGVCAEVITGCKFTHDGKDIFMRFGEKYVSFSYANFCNNNVIPLAYLNIIFIIILIFKHYDCHTEFYCKEDGTHMQRDIHCPDEFCNFDLRTGNTYCEYLGFDSCLENGYKMIALPIFT